MFDNLKKYLPLILLILLATAIKLWWVFHINYTAEDSYITFQFARNLARGEGFALNPGQPVQGSTTPLLSFMLAGWLLISKDIVWGARAVDLLAVVGGMVFLYLAIPDKQVAVIALFITSISARLYIEEMQGMEMPLTFLFLAASFFGFMQKRPIFAGIMAGLLLWSRVDTVFWVGCLFVIYLLVNRRQALEFFLATTAVYLPWILFSWAYFGSPIPLTITAKQVAYGLHSPPAIEHLKTIFNYVSWPVLAFALLSIPSIWKVKNYWVFPLFIAIELSQLSIFGTTYFFRYFYLLTLVCYVLLGFGVTDLISGIRISFLEWGRFLLPAALVLIAGFSWNTIDKSYEYHSHQQGVTAMMGQWLNANTLTGSTVLLEPLGYTGWYADRIMIDEVGLVTPKVVALQGRIPPAEFFRVFWPDYVVWKCGAGGKARTEIVKYYDIVQRFGENTSPCIYEIWKRKPASQLITQVQP